MSSTYAIESGEFLKFNVIHPGEWNASDGTPQAIEALKRIPLLPILVVDGDFTIAECAEKMKEHGTTAVVVADNTGKIDGIFTDRDLFLKMNSKNGVDWGLAVRLMMSRPVLTLAPDVLYLAPELMASKRIRHVPVVSTDSNGTHRILGLLTMDAIFTGNVAAMKAWRDYSVHEASPVSVIGICTDDKALGHSIEQVLGHKGKMPCRTIKRAELMTPTSLQNLGDSVPNLILDADGFDPKKLAKVVHTLVTKCQMQKIILLFTQDSLPKPLFKVLLNLQEKGPFKLVPKPIEPMDLVALLKS